MKSAFYIFSDVTKAVSIRYNVNQHIMTYLEEFHKKIYAIRLFKLFTWGVRILLAIAFLPSGYTKLVGNRFTLLDLDNPVGFFFEAMYRTGWYWNFLGFMQLLVALLILIPKTTFAATLLYLPIIINIFFITISMDFKGTPIITGLMLVANLYLLFWQYPKMKRISPILFEK